MFSASGRTVSFSTMVNSASLKIQAWAMPIDAKQHAQRGSVANSPTHSLTCSLLPCRLASEPLALASLLHYCRSELVFPQLGARD
jgi:hypothetical protein